MSTSSTFAKRLSAKESSYVFSLAARTYITAQTLSISEQTPGATIYHTTNGTTPPIGSTQCTGAIAVASTETVQAIVVAAGSICMPCVKSRRPGERQPVHSSFESPSKPDLARVSLPSN